MDDRFILAGRSLQSRVLLGTSRYPNRQSMLDAFASSAAEVATVSLRRVGAVEGAQDLYRSLRDRGVHLLPNTAGCFGAADAVLTARLAREALGEDWIKLEVIGDEETLLPDPIGLLEAAQTLIADGFRVLPYTNDDPVLARRLEDLGCAAVMPLGAPIGSGQGLENPRNLERIISRAGVPVIIDAGLGTASDVAQAFELGADAVLLNSAVARATDPALMARAVGLAARAGRDAFHAGRIARKTYAEASSPLEGILRSGKKNDG